MEGTNAYIEQAMPSFDFNVHKLLILNFIKITLDFSLQS